MRREKDTLILTTLFIAIMICFSSFSALAAESAQSLKKQIEVMDSTIKLMQKKVKSLEAKELTKEEEFKEIDERLSKAEIHTATDKLSFGVELRTQAQSLHYKDIRKTPEWLIGGFFGNFNQAGYVSLMNMMNGMTPEQIQSMMTPENIQRIVMPMVGGFNGASKEVIQQMMQMMKGAGIPVDTYSPDNDLIYTNRLRLEMKSKINENLSFAGRLAMYKVFGDSSGVKFNTGSLGDVTLDGNTTSLPHGDSLHVERAYFNLKHQFGEIPVNLSLGRRPATDGAPLEYSNGSLVGGSPIATIINWQFDGASLNFGLEDITGISGSAFKLCYGVGFESDWGNSYSLNANSNINDATFGGFIATIYDDDLTSVIVNYAHAWELTDGFTGNVLMPFIPSVATDGTYTFTPNTGGYISRLEASSNIGDMDMATILVKINFSEIFADIDFFFAPSWSHTNPDAISDNAFYNLMGMGLLNSNGELKTRDGYSIYTGFVLPMPCDARMGFEYNYGSKYWINMTGAEDTLIASKLATRGHVFESYYIQPVYDNNFIIKLGGQYYDYKYTGSGNPLGAPVKISELSALDAFFPVIDDVWNIYLSAVLRF